MPSFGGGGAERVMITLAHGFSGHGVPVDIVVAQRQGPYESEAPEGARIVDLAARRVLTSLPGLTRYLRREAPHAMLSALPHCNVISVWARSMARTGTRLVLSEHTTASMSAANAEQRRARILPAFMRLTYRKADAIVAVSEGVADDLAELVGLERSRISTIYNPVVTPKLFALAAEPVKHPWFIEAGPPVILAVGRLTAVKDFATLIRGFASVRKKRYARLMILGEGEQRASLMALIHELGIEADVELPGFVSNPYKYMKHASVFVLSSKWEGFGNVLVEAMACGVPVVSTDCRTGPREILDGGRYGLLTPVADAEALADAIVRQLDMPADTACAIERAKTFTLDAALGKYLQTLAL